MQDIRHCTQLKHDQQQIQYVCMFDQCELPRLLCSQCLFSELHKHGQLNNKHIVTLEMLNQIMQTDLEQLQKKYQRKQIEFRNLMLLMKKQLDAINDSIQQIRQRRLQKLTLKNIIQANKFSLVDEDLIRQIIRDKQFQIDDIAIPQILNQSQTIQQSTFIPQQPYPQPQHQPQPQPQPQQIINLQNMQYEALTIDEQKNEHKFYTAAMSNNLQFIALGGSEGILKIYNHRIPYQNIIFSQKIIICKFSQDDQQLYVGLESNLAQLSAFNGFQQQKIIQLQNKYILDFSFVTNTVLLVVNNKYISKVDFQILQITLHLLAHNQQIQSIDINQSRMISCSSDNSIKLWNHVNGQQLISKNDVCAEIIDLRQVKFIQFDQFLSLQNGKIYLWTINLKNQFQRIKLFESKNYIFQIHFVLEGQLIFLIQDTNVQVINLKGEKIKSIEHGVKQLTKKSICSQSSNVLQILIQGEDKIAICKSINSQ